MTRSGDHAPFDRSPPRADGAPHQPAEHLTPQSTRWQFGLPALLGTMMLLCLPFAIWGAILRANEDEQLVLMLLCIATPLGVLVLAALSVSLRNVLRDLRRARQRRRPPLPDHPPDE
jgi:hypothetical protein